MTERERIIAICRDLNLPTSQYVINGSGAMIMQGITAEQRGKPMGDLDVFCATALWFDVLGQRKVTLCNDRHHARLQTFGPRLIPWSVFLTDPDDPETRVDPPYLYAVMYGLEVNIFHSWRRRAVGNFDLAFYIKNAKVVDGVPCAWLQWVYDWKCEVGRAKDQVDIEILRRYDGVEEAPLVPPS